MFRNRYRWRHIRFAKKELGAILLVVGALLFVLVLPVRFWLALAGAGLCWFGWKLVSDP